MVVKEACFDMLQKRAKNRRYCIKKKHFDNKPANEVSIKSPEPDLMSDEEWQGLVKLWSTGRHKVCMYMCPGFCLHIPAVMQHVLPV